MKTEMTEGSTPVNGHITVHTTWTLADSPYTVVGGVIVDTGVYLTIEPGVVVRFTAGASLVIDGGLIARGNATHKITFTSNATLPAPGDWAGILIRSNARCNITNSVLEYATIGINFESLGFLNIFTHSQVTSNIVGMRVDGYGIRMEELTIENNTDCGIYGDSGDIVIKKSSISKNNIGINGEGGFAYIDNCSISNNVLDGIYSDWIMHIKRILDSTIANNGGWGININAKLENCRDTRISNNSGGGVYVDFWQGAKIYNCNITNNNGHGVFSAYGLTLSGSIVSNNSIHGVSAQSVNIESSTITDNDNVGVSSNGGKMHFSNVYNNGLYEVKSTGSNNIDATYNWWETTYEALIEESIYDYFDDNSLGEVSYLPFLNSSKATLNIFTNGVSSDEPVKVERDGFEVGLVNDEEPLNLTVYSGHTQPNMGTFGLSIENVRIWNSNPGKRYKFINWTGPAGSGASCSITITVTANSSIAAFYKTQHLTNFTFKDSSGTETLSVEPREIRLVAPNGSAITLTSFLNQWLDEGTWTIKRIQWQNNNVKPYVDPAYAPLPGGTWTINCRVYLISFSNSFKDSDGNDLHMLPSSFKLTFPNGTTSVPSYPNSSFYIQNGTTTWSSIIWQGTEVSPEDLSFDATNGNPTVSCCIYSLTVNPVFYDNTGTALVQPSLWSIAFPNATTKVVSSPVTYNQTQTGEYSITSITWNGVEVIPNITPTISLTSDKFWSPSINCLLPTSFFISLGSSTSYVGFKVEINGNLTCNEVGLSGAPVLLYYSVTGGETWNDITLVNTTSDGGYSATWIPSATGNYLVRAIWLGNSTYPGTTTIINLAVISFREQNVFSVTSNSTVSDLAFNSTSRQLSFTVTGPSGTTGYINVHIAKTLVDSIVDVKVYLDGLQLNYTATSLDDTWLLHFTYMHSTHKVTVSLGDIPSPFIETPLGKALIYVVPITAIVILTTLYLLRKKRGDRQKFRT